jgi:hypothetical protein
MNKQFPWGIILSLVAIVLISLGGGYLLYRVIDEASPFRPVAVPEKPAASPPAGPPVRAVSVADAEGYLVINLRASVELSPSTGAAAYESALENKGFSQDCPGKVVATDFRSQGKDYWSEEEGAIADAQAVVCLPATSRAFTDAFGTEVSEARVSLDDDDAAALPSARLEGKGKSVFVQTGKSGYLLYAGGVTAKSCDSGCEAGAAAGVSVTRVSRPLAEDRFVFSVPAGDAKSLNVAAALPVTQ